MVVNLFKDNVKREQVGNKAFNLQTLFKNNIKVPNSYVITNQFHIDFLENNNVYDPFSTPKKVLNGEFSERQTENLRELLHAFRKDELLVCRSSSLSEDNENVSFAGQFKSIVGFCNKLSELIIAVKVCWYDYYNSGAAKAYRNSLDISDNKHMALIIQPMCSSKVSGVAFINNKETLTIESNWGLASSVVDGLVTPDQTIIDNENKIMKKKNDKSMATLHISDLYHYEIGDQVWIELNNEDHLCSLLMIDPFEQIGIYQLPKTLAGQYSLTNKDIKCLQSAVKSIKKIYSQDVDIEWSINEDGVVEILQVRPITKELPEHIENVTKGSGLKHNGVSASIGYCQGDAKIITSNEDFYKMNEGDVIVCRSTDPSYIEVMRKSSGIISEEGGILSHTAIVARELGIPCVTDVKGATKKFKDFMMLSIDGYEGTVSIEYDYNLKLSLKNDVMTTYDCNTGNKKSNVNVYISLLYLEFSEFCSFHKVNVDEFISFIADKFQLDVNLSVKRNLVMDLNLLFEADKLESKIINSDIIKKHFIIDNERII
ncbi:PEP/pyruvate-binding domain-containing protein [Shouchella lehensis]|uniref:Phosphoenolpyruvate synthase n=1 Tax=Shouchella lehensis TaxID=300825 RepID=A0A4Y7WMA1_9BACI|nr:PEP/pyruvate-binding domain-containing protein [Shouchella lehensis]MBG9783148.1 hypothetical protein [Shouchella lehensis]TES49487.1 hypothetical protein E2L03_08440 [Shouchella lehensis]